MMLHTYAELLDGIWVRRISHFSSIFMLWLKIAQTYRNIYRNGWAAEPGKKQLYSSKSQSTNKQRTMCPMPNIASPMAQIPMFNWPYVCSLWKLYLIELDNGKILSGKPDQFDGKTHGFPVKIFPTKPIQWMFFFLHQSSFH